VEAEVEDQERERRGRQIWAKSSEHGESQQQMGIYRANVLNASLTPVLPEA
jgi:hypothetical protein